MNYCENDKICKLSLGEFVMITRRRGFVSTPRDEDEPICVLCDAENSSLSLKFTVGAYHFLLYTPMPSISHGIPCHTYSVASVKRIKKSEKTQAISEGYIILKMLFDSEYRHLSAGGIDINYIDEDSGEIISEHINPEIDKIDLFFDKCKSLFAKYGFSEIERVTERLPSMANAKFPFSEIRQGQNEFIRAAYRAMAQGSTLFAEAPTGTGKTVSAIFPAIRALGDKRISKVFYLTPKTTTARAAVDTLELFSSNGVRVRGVVLLAKERLCQGGMICRINPKACGKLSKNRLAEATDALFDKHLAVATPEDISRTAEDFGCCPYELALSYSELCDIVICDFNYLFSPDNYIRRYFTAPGNYAFLVDEAHNLVDRARDMYSSELLSSDFIGLGEASIIPENSGVRLAVMTSYDQISKMVFSAVKDEIITDKFGVQRSAYHTKNPPSEIYDVISRLKGYLSDELFKLSCAKDEENQELSNLIRDFLYRLTNFDRALMDFDDGYDMFIFTENDSFRIKLYAIDPARHIKKRLALGRAAVFFSGTLTPIDYYRTTLGGDGDSVMLTLGSPFDEEQLSVSIVDSVSTRYSEREDTLSAVCRVIACTLSVKRGNYMVFSPSFAYSQALSSLFKKKYPKINVLTQSSGMSAKEKREFLDAFNQNDGKYLVGFAVMGGIYAEGVDLAGDKLIGAVVVGIGMPQLSYEREAIAAYYEEKIEEGKQYAYVYPGINRVFQAAGRVIRTETDKGVVVLIDDRFQDPIYRKTAPKLWHGMKFISDVKTLENRLKKFWQNN